MACCTLFAQWISTTISRSLTVADPDLSGPSANPKTPGADPERPYDPQRLQKVQETQRKYEEHFNRHLRILMDSLNYYAATESVVLLKLAHALSTITRDS